MAERRLTRPVVVLRSAPWRVLAGVSLMAAALFGLAGWLHHHEMALLIALVAVGTCAAAAGYVFDEESGDVADATPTSRPVRIAWRLPVAGLLAVAGVGALLGLHQLDPATPWLHLAPVAVGGVALGLALSAALRRGGNPAPGDLAAVVTLGALVPIVLVDPLRRWVSLTSLQTPDYSLGTAVAWVVIVLACALVVLACEADPGRAPARSTSRKDVA
jgi:fluoroquinolone transport system permease protein